MLGRTMLVRVAVSVLGPVGASLDAQTPGFAPWRGIAIEADAEGSEGSMTATDDVRGCVVSFACHPRVVVSADTWEWGGDRWVERDPARLPPFRRGGILVHDAARGRVVLFGGAASGYLAGTWEWDGDVWTLRAPAVSPPLRHGCAAAYDVARSRVVLFGGQNLGDTWEYDGATWTPRFAANAPSPRSGHVMAYDEQRQRVVLHGGLSWAPYGLSAETWEWDGTTWTLRVPFGPMGSSHSMVYDRVRQRCVLLRSSPWLDTLEWDGFTWTAGGTLSLPTVVSSHVMARDPASGSAIVFGNGAQWRWTGTTWIKQRDVGLPSDRFSTQACTDTLRNRIVACTSLGGTHEWDGANWVTLATGTAIRYQAMAFDAANGVTVAFGGDHNGSLNNDTRTWNGVAWSVVPAPSRPSPRYYAQMAYDAARQCVVLYGGAGPSPPQPVPPPIYGDTWTFDGVTWTQQNVPGPSPRATFPMAYDPLRQVVVLHGGGPSGNETWEWNGSAWTQSAPPLSPPARGGAAMAFDPGLGAIVLTAGYPSTPPLLTDTWTWNGITWSPLVAQPAVSPRTFGTLVLDPFRQELLLLGGYLLSNSQPYACREGQWLRSSVTLPQVSSVGPACSVGTAPRLSSPLPYVGNPNFAIDLLDASPATVCCVGFSTTVLPQPIGPCTLQLGGGPSVLLAAVTSNAGSARFTLPLPYTPSLVGAQLVAQGVVLSPTGPLFGLDLTAARVMRLGD